MNKKVLLMILDGWGITQEPAVSAVAQANTTFIDSLLTNFLRKNINSGNNVGYRRAMGIGSRTLIGSGKLCSGLAK